MAAAEAVETAGHPIHETPVAHFPTPYALLPQRHDRAIRAAHDQRPLSAAIEIGDEGGDWLGGEGGLPEHLQRAAAELERAEGVGGDAADQLVRAVAVHVRDDGSGQGEAGQLQARAFRLARRAVQQLQGRARRGRVPEARHLQPAIAIEIAHLTAGDGGVACFCRRAPDRFAVQREDAVDVGRGDQHLVLAVSQEVRGQRTAVAAQPGSTVCAARSTVRTKWPLRPSTT